MNVLNFPTTVDRVLLQVAFGVREVEALAQSFAAPTPDGSLCRSTEAWGFIFDNDHLECPSHARAPLSAMPLLTSLLAQLEPASIRDETAGKQQHKSSQTRAALLEAAILCLAEIGYARATTELIARRANLSRGAMLHHYATKRDLIESVIDYICYKRMKEFVDSIRRLTDEQRIEQQAGLEIYWQGYLSVDYQAFLELQIAARTDTELRAYFDPKARRFDRLRTEASRLMFPEYQDDWSKLDIAIDFCQATMQGLLLNRDILEPRARRVAVRKLLSAAIYAFRTGALTLDNHPESDIQALDPAPKPRARGRSLPAHDVMKRRSATKERKEGKTLVL